MLKYGFKKELNIPFNKAIDKVTIELKKEGFGILTKIDIKEKFKEKLDIDFKKYLILGVCNPSSAHEAIQAEENIGLMLPCNVIVYEKDNHTIVSIIRPTTVMGMINNEDLNKVGERIENKLKHVIDAL